MWMQVLSSMADAGRGDEEILGAISTKTLGASWTQVRVSSHLLPLPLVARGGGWVLL